MIVTTGGDERPALKELLAVVNRNRHRVRLGPHRQQRAQDLGVAHHARDHHRSATTHVGGLDVRTCDHELLGKLVVPVLTSKHEGRHIVGSAHVHDRLRFQQQLHTLQLVLTACPVQSGEAGTDHLASDVRDGLCLIARRRPLVRVRIRVEQQLQDAPLAQGGHAAKRRQAVSEALIDVRTAGDGYPHRLDISCGKGKFEGATVGRGYFLVHCH